MRPSIVVGAVISLALVTGCGSKDDDPTTSTSTTAAEVSSTTGAAAPSTTTAPGAPTTAPIKPVVASNDKLADGDWCGDLAYANAGDSTLVLTAWVNGNKQLTGKAYRIPVKQTADFRDTGDPFAPSKPPPSDEARTAAYLQFITDNYGSNEYGKGFTVVVKDGAVERASTKSSVSASNAKLFHDCQYAGG